MRRIAVELDAKLQSLDSSRAEELIRKVREAMASVEATDPPFVDPGIDPMLGVENGWPLGYFARTLGMFADESAISQLLTGTTGTGVLDERPPGAKENRP